jgi:hypothetical protein
MNSGTLAAQSSLNQTGKFRGGSNGAILNNVSRYPPAVTLFTVFPYESGQILF